MLRENILQEFSKWDSEKQLREYQSYKALGDFSPFSQTDYELMEMVMNNPNAEVSCDNGICEISQTNIQDETRLDERSINAEISSMLDDEDKQRLLIQVLDIVFKNNKRINKRAERIRKILKSRIYKNLNKIAKDSLARENDILFKKDDSNLTSVISKLVTFLGNKRYVLEPIFKKLIPIKGSSISAKQLLNYPIFKILFLSILSEKASYKQILNMSISSKNKELRNRLEKIKSIRRLILDLQNVRKLFLKSENRKSSDFVKTFKDFDVNIEEKALLTFEAVINQIEDEKIKTKLRDIIENKDISELNPKVDFNNIQNIKLSDKNKLNAIVQNVRLQKQKAMDFFIDIADDKKDSNSKFVEDLKKYYDSDKIDNLTDLQIAALSKKLLKEKFYTIRKGINPENDSNIELFKQIVTEGISELSYLGRIDFGDLPNEISHTNIMLRLDKVKSTLGVDFDKFFVYAKSLNFGNENEGPFERLLQFLFPGSKLSGGSKSYDFFYQDKKYEIKSFKKGDAIKLGKEAAMTKFPNLINVLLLLEELFYLFEDETKSEIFFEMGDQKEIEKLKDLIFEKKDSKNNSHNLISGFREGEVNSKLIQSLKYEFFETLNNVVTSITQHNDYNDIIHYKDKVYKITQKKACSVESEDCWDLSIQPDDDILKTEVLNSIHRISSIPGILDPQYFVDTLDSLDEYINYLFENHPMILFNEKNTSEEILRKSTTSPDGLFRKFKIAYITRRNLAIFPIEDVIEE